MFVFVLLLGTQSRTHNSRNRAEIRILPYVTMWYWSNTRQEFWKIRGNLFLYITFTVCVVWCLFWTLRLLLFQPLNDLHGLAWQKRTKIHIFLYLLEKNVFLFFFMIPSFSGVFFFLIINIPFFLFSLQITFFQLKTLLQAYFFPSNFPSVFLFGHFLIIMTKKKDKKCL